MITWIYLIGVLVSFFLCIVKINANGMQREFLQTTEKFAVLFMSSCSWLGVIWLFLNDEI
jgi:glucan phosphoethanolaminetransferase (alkaline phosphatase superfamily)